MPASIDRAIKEAAVYKIAIKRGYIVRHVAADGVVELSYKDRAGYDKLRRDAGLI